MSQNDETLGGLVVNGIVTVATAANVKATAGTNTAITFTTQYSYRIRDRILGYRRGQTVVVDAATLTALQAASAPIVLA